MPRRGRQVQVWFDDDTYAAIVDLSDEVGVRPTHTIEALARMLRDLKPAQVKRLIEEAHRVKAERDRRQGHH